MISQTPPAGDDECQLSLGEPNSEARSMNYRINATRLIAIAVLFALVAASTVAFAQNLKVKGVIISRAGNTMTLKADTGNVVVVLNDRIVQRDIF